MMDTSSTTASSSSAGNIEDILRVIAPYDREAFNQMLEYKLRGRGELAADEVRRIAVDTWRQFLKHGWPK
jgi:hypothetical protein